MIPSIEDRRRDAEFMARLAARIEEDMSLLTKLGKVTSPRDAIKAEIVAIWDESDAERKRLASPSCAGSTPTSAWTDARRCSTRSNGSVARCACRRDPRRGRRVTAILDGSAP